MTPTPEQLQAIKALAARDESAVAMCSEYQRAIVTLLAEVERLTAELASYKRNAAYISSVIESEGVYRP